MTVEWWSSPASTRSRTCQNLASTEMFKVHDLQARALHLIVVRRLDYRSRRVRGGGDVVVFSKPRFAAFRTPRLQLATPRYYREHEELEEDIRDRHDGTLTKDATPWARTIAGPSARAEVLFASTREPWVYCASHYHLNSELRDLKAEFAKCGYTAVDRNSGPQRLRQVAWHRVRADPRQDERCFGSGRLTGSPNARCPDIDTVVFVHHGPVHYEDRSGRIATQEDLGDLAAGPKACFTKKTRFKFQSEYRFAVSTHGDPVEQRHYITVSPELREFCREV